MIDKILTDLPTFVERLNQSMAQLRLTEEGNKIANKIDELIGNEDIEGLNKLLAELK